MATNISAWYPDINMRIIGVPQPTQLIALRDAIRSFCEKTHLWKETLAEIDIVASTNVYTITKANAEIVMVLNAKYKQPKSDGTESDDDQYYTLTPAVDETLDRILTGSWEWRTTSAPSEYYISDYTEPEAWVLSFTEIPDTASIDGLRVKVAIKPDNSATTVEDFFYSNHKDAITYKACSILYGLTAMPWANIEFSVAFDRVFNTECVKAAQFRRKGGTIREMKFQYQQFV